MKNQKIVDRYVSPYEVTSRRVAMGLLRIMRGERNVMAAKNGGLCPDCSRGGYTAARGCVDEECNAKSVSRSTVTIHWTDSPSLGVIEVNGNKSAVTFGDGWVALDWYGTVNIKKSINRTCRGITELYQVLADPGTAQYKKRVAAIEKARLEQERMSAWAAADIKHKAECMETENRFRSMARNLGVEHKLGFSSLRPPLCALYLRNEQMSLEQAEIVIQAMIRAGVL